ncbi:MAG: D-aminoacyl-tRNA deacylase [Promethearchaeati archaeon SRVP18_Atabeyarchaeia-1]
MPVIVTSDLDVASVNIRKQLIRLFGFREKEEEPSFDGNPVYRSGEILLISSKRELVDTEHVEQCLKTDLMIFASRHRSTAGKPALLVHCTGNWTKEAELGGMPYELAVAPASAMSEALLELARQKDKFELLGYEVTLECTHHGPTSMSTPLLFVELGSNEEHWRDEVAGEAVARTVFRVAQGVRERRRAALGVGGPHYAPNFTRVVQSSSEIAIGHIIPNYVLEAFRSEMVRKAIERTFEKVGLVLLDWKGLRSDQRELIKPIINELNLETLKTHEITKSS